MLILHDPATLEHKTIELLGAKLIPALESPERISAILEAVQTSNAHEIKTVHFRPDSSSATSSTSEGLLEILSSTHDAGYLHHLSHAHSSWVHEGLIDQNESILPECFPYPNSANGSQAAAAGASNHPASTSSNSNADPPRDIFARAGFYAFDMSTGICASTYTSALASANLASSGVRILFDNAITERSQPPSQFPPPQQPQPRPLSSPAKTPPPTVLALCRPPGHHCDTRRAGGYCYLNNAVVAVETFRRLQQQSQQQLHHHEPKKPPSSPSSSPSASHTSNPTPSPPSELPPRRIAILDLDFHHGNGTQEAFWSDSSVLYISIHGQDEYPYYTGSASETGPSPFLAANPSPSSCGPNPDLRAGGPNASLTLGPSLTVGTNLNLPLPTHTPLPLYLSTLSHALSRLLAFRPAFVILSLGFDTFHLDPLGSFGISTDDYEVIARMVAESLKTLKGIGRMEAGGEGGQVPCLILLEGGYVVEELGANLLSFLRGWEGV